MRYVDNSEDRLLDQVVRALTAYVRDEADATGIVLHPGVVQRRELRPTQADLVHVCAPQASGRFMFGGPTYSFATARVRIIAAGKGNAAAARYLLPKRVGWRKRGVGLAASATLPSHGVRPPFAEQ